MATEQFIGQQNGNTYWFAPSDWSGGFVPIVGDTAEVFGNAQIDNAYLESPEPGPMPPPDAFPLISGVTIDLSAQASDTPFLTEYGDGANIVATALGSADQPVTIDVTADSGQAANAAITVTDITGSLNIEKGSALTIASQGNLTINGTVDVQGTLTVVSVLNGAHTINDYENLGSAVVDGGTLDLQTTGASAVTIENGGTVSIGGYPYIGPGISDVTFNGPDAGTYISQLYGTFSGQTYSNGQATTIHDFGVGDKVVLYSLEAPTNDFTYSGNTLSIYDQYGRVDQSIDFAGTYAAANFVVTTDGNSSIIQYVPISANSVISGTVSGQTASDYRPVSPFAGVKITDPNGGSPTERVTVTSSDPANGTFVDPNSATDGGVVNGNTYTVSGTAAQATSAIDGLTFVPTQHEVAPGQKVTTTFSISDTNSQGATTVDQATSVTVTALNYVDGPATGHGVLIGSFGDDVITAHGLGNVIFGLAGNDIIDGGDGSAFVSVGSGSSSVTLGGGDNLVIGRDGDVTVTGAPDGSTAVVLGNGNDVVSLGGENDYVFLGNGNDSVSAGHGMSFITTGSGNDQISAVGVGSTINAGGGTNTIVGGWALDTFVLPAASTGIDSIRGFLPYNLDKLDLRDALAGTTWNGSQSTLGNYVKVASNGSDTMISIAQHGSGSSVAVADLVGSGSLTFALLERQHSLIT